MRMVQGQLKTFNHLHFFFVLLPQGRYRSIHYRGLSKALLFSSGIIFAFDISKSFTLKLFSNSQPGGHLLHYRAGTQNSMTSSLSLSSLLLWGLNLLMLYIFQMPTHLVITLPSGIPFMQFMWHFSCLLFILRHRYILFLKSTNLHGLSNMYVGHSISFQTFFYIGI